MPRVARVDIEGELYHVIGRGVDRRSVFRSVRDCEDFEDRLSVLGGEEEMRLFAYVLMVNHVLCAAAHKACYGERCVMRSRSRDRLRLLNPVGVFCA